MEISKNIYSNIINYSVYVVVVNYNGEKWIKKCLDSLKNSEFKVCAIIVDNLSEDGSLEIIKNNYTEFELIKNSKNLGFGSANNIGIIRALKNKADYVFLLNQDAWIENDTINKLLDVAVNNENYGVISPIHLNANKTSMDFGFKHYIDELNCPSFISDMYLGNLQPIYNLPFVNAAGWLISKKCLEITGGFDPIFFMYGEDFDYCNRLKFYNFRIGIIPNANMCHARSNHVINRDKNRYSIKEKINIKAYDIAFLKDINKTFLPVFITWILRCLSLIIKLSLQFKFIKVAEIIFCKIYIVFHLPDILKSRFLSKKNMAFL